MERQKAAAAAAALEGTPQSACSQRQIPQGSEVPSDTASVDARTILVAFSNLSLQAERQAIERQKAAAAAAALEVTAAETAGRAVKEREDVVALLEKEKEELQLEAADALEKHAKEVSEKELMRQRFASLRI